MDIPRYIDPTSDFGFKRIFASEPNKDILVAFVNEFFKGRKTIVDLVYDKNEFVGDIEEMGAVILDLTCIASNGERFVIEVQRTLQANLKRRILYYASKLVADQAPKGKRREWNYDISEIYIIVLMDNFRMPDSKPTKQYLHNISLCDRNTGEVFYKYLEFFYVELVNFVKSERELESDLDRWLYVLKNMATMDHRLPAFAEAPAGKPTFEKLFMIAEYSKLNKEERSMYDISLKRKWDKKAVLDYAREEGLKEGMEMGIEKGRLEERVRAETEKLAEKRAIALELKKMGIAPGDITKATGLPLDTVENLA